MILIFSIERLVLTVLSFSIYILLFNIFQFASFSYSADISSNTRIRTIASKQFGGVKFGSWSYF